MALQDLTQYKRKLKHPQIRKWTHEKGSWGYYKVPGTKIRLSKAQKLKSTNRIHYAVAYKGKEYGTKEFLRKYPRFKLKKKR